MLACCGAAPDCERTSTATSLDNDDCKIAGANDPGGPLPSIAVGPAPPSDGAACTGAAVGGEPPAGTATTDDEPSDPTTTVVCTGFPTESFDPPACFVDPELEQATRTSATTMAPVQRWRLTWAILVGNPAITEELRRKIFGLNAASLFKIDPTELRCALADDPLTAAQPMADELRAEGTLPSPWRPNGPTTRRELLRTLANATTPWVPS